MQASLALVGLLASVVAWSQGAGVAWLAWGVLFGMLIPFTLIVIKPTNQRLLDPGLDSSSPEAGQLLSRWGRLHAVRTVVGVAVFIAFVAMSLRS